MFRWLLSVVSDNGTPDATYKNSELLETIIPIIVFVLIFAIFIFGIRAVKKHFAKNEENNETKSE